MHIRQIGARASRQLAAVAAMCVVALGLAGCAPKQQEPTSIGSSNIKLPPKTVSEFAKQDLQWKPCGDIGAECADVYAPLDWSKPEGNTLTLHLARMKSTSAKPQGTLFVNFGGPGAGGAEIVTEVGDNVFSSKLREQFDIIAWDPRGTGKSSPVNCLSTSQLDTLFLGNPVLPANEEVGSSAWYAAVQKYSKAIANGCEANLGPELGHISTADTARDLDMLRGITGSKQLNYLGWSYGTVLGSTYASMYPQQVGRMVLDAALSPTKSLQDYLVEQAEAVEGALRRFLADCINNHSDCPFKRVSGEGPVDGAAASDPSVDAAVARVQQLLAQLDEKPLPMDAGLLLSGEGARFAFTYVLASQTQWSMLRDALVAALGPEADVSKLSELAKKGVERGEKRYESTLLQSFLAITCSDYGRTFGTRDAAVEFMEKMQKASPTLGKHLAMDGLACNSWPSGTSQLPKSVSVKLQTPALVVGGVGDANTPYEWSKQLVQEMGSAVLLTSNTEGHGAYLASECAMSAIDSYLASGEAPPTGKVCEAGPAS